jgi:alpha-L-arabinofuranosidase
VLDLVEWAHGPATSEWGAMRAAAGHPAPFGLTHLGVGNEEAMTPAFAERFEAINAAVKARHPEITVVGTVGPFSDGTDYDKGWKIADRLKLAMVDEHYYKPPDWFWDNRLRYDAYNRDRSRVYLGEYAAHDDKRRTTLRSALAEAAYMTALERNGDVVQMASYAPLLAKAGHTQWNPDLIYFTNTKVAPTVNYYVQQLFGRNSGDAYVPHELTGVDEADRFAASTVRDGESGDLILKLVNGADEARPLRIELSGAAEFDSTGAVTLLASEDPMAANTLEHPDVVAPRSSTVDVGPEFHFEAAPFSLTIIRIKPRVSRAARP